MVCWRDSGAAEDECLFVGEFWEAESGEFTREKKMMSAAKASFLLVAAL